jgi:hypothetical protein
MGLFDGFRGFARMIPDEFELKALPEPATVTPAAEQKADPTSTRSGVDWVGAPDWRYIVSLGAGGVSPNAESLGRSLAFATSAYAYTAIMYRAERMGEPPLMVVKETEDGEEWQANHRLNEMLDEPSPDYDMGELK